MSIPTARCQIVDYMSAIREMRERGKVDLQRINKKWEIADCLFKKAASRISILTTHKNEKLHETIVFDYRT